MTEPLRTLRAQGETKEVRRQPLIIADVGQKGPIGLCVTRLAAPGDVPFVDLCPGG
jgi:hypothetical protein